MAYCSLFLLTCLSVGSPAPVSLDESLWGTHFHLLQALQHHRLLCLVDAAHFRGLAVLQERNGLCPAHDLKVYCRLVIVYRWGQ